MRYSSIAIYLFFSLCLLPLSVFFAQIILPLSNILVHFMYNLNYRRYTRPVPELRIQATGVGLLCGPPTARAHTIALNCPYNHARGRSRLQELMVVLLLAVMVKKTAKKYGIGNEAVAQRYMWGQVSC